MPMNDTPVSISDKIRQQFDFGPYPRTPIDKSPKDDVNQLFTHNFITPYYLRNQQVPKIERPVILDAGCGSGYTSLILAEANPHAQIVGIDVSAESIKLAEMRLKHHGFGDAQFHVLSIEELPSLGMEFDYINCDEVLYFLPEPAAGLRSMRSILKPHGIIRANLHSALQRAPFYRAQKVFQMMGLFDTNPEELEIGLVQEVMKALAPHTNLKQQGWNPKWGNDNVIAHEVILANFLLQGDQGFTVSDMFQCIETADLEFISMVNWVNWDIYSLFQNPDDLPVFLTYGLSETTAQEKLSLFELLHPVHRLLDFWCGMPKLDEDFSPLATWDTGDWQKAHVQIHPQLTTQKAKEAFLKTVSEQVPIDLASLLSAPTAGSYIANSSIAALLLLLMDGPKSYRGVVEYWLQLYPKDPLTLEPLTADIAEKKVQKILSQLEVFLYVLIEIH